MSKHRQCNISFRTKTALKLHQIKLLACLFYICDLFCICWVINVLFCSWVSVRERRSEMKTDREVIIAPACEFSPQVRLRTRSGSLSSWGASWHILASCFWFSARKTFSNHQLLDWFIKLGVCFSAKLAVVILAYCVGGCYADAGIECSRLLLGCSSGCSMLFWRILGCF